MVLILCAAGKTHISSESVWSARGSMSEMPRETSCREPNGVLLYLGEGDTISYLVSFPSKTKFKLFGFSDF